MKLTIIMPCLNEAETLATCINKAKSWISNSKLEAEIVIADNGSTDGSQKIATDLGARVVPVSQRGYGAALSQGAHSAKGEWIIMGDSDDSYDFSSLDPFIEKLSLNYDLVMGNRFLGGIKPGAMPWKNRYIGNPILTWIGKFLFSSPANDFHCGLRAFKKEAFLKMDLRTTGMEFASEMVIKATLNKMRICEVPTTLSKDGRSRPPHLRPWRDGWRHLRFMLLFSPRWLLFIPGLTLFLFSAIFYAALLRGPVWIFNVGFDINTLLFAEAGIITGALAALSGVIVKLFGFREGLLQKNERLDWFFKKPILEVGSSVGLISILGGVVIAWLSLNHWADVGFGALVPGQYIRIVSLATLLVTMGGLVLVMSLIAGFLSLPTYKK